MREIKFRFWNPDTKMYYADTGLTSLGVNDAIKKAIETHFIIEQYIEKKDKNGKEIFEGDLVVYYWLAPIDHNRKEYSILEVKYSCEAGKYILIGNDLGEHFSHALILRTESYEIMGNIHENIK